MRILRCAPRPQQSQFGFAASEFDDRAVRAQPGRRVALNGFRRWLADGVPSLLRRRSRLLLVPATERASRIAGTYSVSKAPEASGIPPHYAEGPATRTPRAAPSTVSAITQSAIRRSARRERAETTHPLPPKTAL